ncbi:MAG: hemerythrin family protein [Nitrospirae bacterium]|nr:hemerythrin family protein [Nitrospirota bacterium]
MDIKWTEDLTVGVDSIDDQHKEMIAIINNLLQAINRGDARDEIEKVIAFLKKYVEAHFLMEETLMLRIKYPKDKFLEHERKHTQFWETYNELAATFKKEHRSPILVNTIKNVLVGWFVNHICQTDKAIGVFIKKEGKDTKAYGY